MSVDNNKSPQLELLRIQCYKVGGKGGASRADFDGAASEVRNLQRPEECLSCNRCSINTCWMSVALRGQPSRVGPGGQVKNLKEEGAGLNAANGKVNMRMSLWSEQRGG